MSEIEIITYLRSDESVNENIKLIINTFKKKYPHIRIVFFTDRDRDDINNQIKIPYEVINFPGTKYRRLKKLLDSESNKILISIDNDTTIIPEAFLEFINNFIDTDQDIGWARIKALKQKSFIARMVSVDKLLSHTIIRPLLWRLNIGISIPGQLFVLRSDVFCKKLLDVDTFLDDLALGLYVNLNFNKLNVLMSKNFIAMENPKISFKDLYIQRKRWAKGFFSIWQGVNVKKEKKLVALHGFAYHVSWILNWIIMTSLAVFLWPTSIIYLLIVAFIISRKDLVYYFDSIVYQIFFPVFHIIWIIFFLKGDTNENNG